MEKCDRDTLLEQSLRSKTVQKSWKNSQGFEPGTSSSIYTQALYHSANAVGYSPHLISTL